MNLAIKPLNKLFTYSNPSAEERDSDQAHSTKTSAKNIATPVTRCNMDALPDGGNEIVVRSRFTGLCFFTVTCPSDSVESIFVVIYLAALRY